MKKFLVFFLVFILLQIGVLAQNTAEKSEEEIIKQITKIEKEINRLEEKLKGISLRTRRMKIGDLITGHGARIEKLEKELEEILKAKFEPEIEELATPEVQYVPSETKEEKIPVERVEVEKGKRFEFEIGGAAGLFAATTAICGELRFPLPYVFGPCLTSLRISGGLMQTGDMGRRYVPIQIDGILNFPPGWFTGVENYLGAGLNYVVLTSGRTSGTIGGEVFYGVESEGFGGKLFGEIGYGILRTGFSPSHKGITVLVGYRREWSF